MEDFKEEIKCEIRLLLHTKILKVAKPEDLEHTASNILALMEKTDGGATVPCSGMLSAIADGMKKAQEGQAEEGLAGNIVKEALWRGEEVAFRQLENFIRHYMAHGR